MANVRLSILSATFGTKSSQKVPRGTLFPYGYPLHVSPPNLSRLSPRSAQNNCHRQFAPPKSQGGEAYVSLCLYRLSIFFFVKLHLYNRRGRRPLQCYLFVYPFCREWIYPFRGTHKCVPYDCYFVPFAFFIFCGIIILKDVMK